MKSFIQSFILTLTTLLVLSTFAAEVTRLNLDKVDLKISHVFEQAKLNSFRAARLAPNTVVTQIFTIPNMSNYSSLQFLQLQEAHTCSASNGIKLRFFIKTNDGQKTEITTSQAIEPKNFPAPIVALQVQAKTRVSCNKVIFEFVISGSKIAPPANTIAQEKPKFPELPAAQASFSPPKFDLVKNLANTYCSANEGLLKNTPADRLAAIRALNTLYCAADQTFVFPNFKDKNTDLLANFILLEQLLVQSRSAAHNQASTYLKLYQAVLHSHGMLRLSIENEARKVLGLENDATKLSQSLNDLKNWAKALVQWQSTQ